MLDVPTPDSAASANAAPVRRYAPPNQRYRGLGRRKSGGDRLERANSYTADGEKTQGNASRNIPIGYLGDSGSSNRVGEISSARLIPIYGCSNNEAIQHLNDRWTAAVNALNSLPKDSSERPVMYVRSGPSWGQAILPHMMVPAAASGGMKKDFASELHQAIRNANAGYTPNPM